MSLCKWMTEQELWGIVKIQTLLRTISYRKWWRAMIFHIPKSLGTLNGKVIGLRQMDLNIRKWLKELKRRRSENHSLLKSVTILRRIVKYWGNLLTLYLQCKPSDVTENSINLKHIWQHGRPRKLKKLLDKLIKEIKKKALKY